MSGNIIDYRLCSGYNLNLVEERIQQNVFGGFQFLNKRGIQKDGTVFYVEMVKYESQEVVDTRLMADFGLNPTTLITGDNRVSNLTPDNDDNDDIDDSAEQQLNRMGIM